MLGGGWAPEPVRVLLMLIVANSAAWLAGRFPSVRPPLALDGGLIAWDGQPLLGSHKSWRGFIAGVAASSVIGGLCGVAWWVAAGFGFLSLSGDALSGAVKRRLRRPPGADVPLLDQLPEALLPVLSLWSWLAISWPEAAVVIGLFVLLDLLWTRRWSTVLGRLVRRHS